MLNIAKVILSQIEALERQTHAAKLRDSIDGATPTLRALCGNCEKHTTFRHFHVAALAQHVLWFRCDIYSFMGLWRPIESLCADLQMLSTPHGIDEQIEILKSFLANTGGLQATLFTIVLKKWIGEFAVPTFIEQAKQLAVELALHDPTEDASTLGFIRSLASTATSLRKIFVACDNPSNDVCAAIFAAASRVAELVSAVEHIGARRTNLGTYVKIAAIAGGIAYEFGAGKASGCECFTFRDIARFIAAANSPNGVEWLKFFGLAQCAKEKRNELIAKVHPEWGSNPEGFAQIVRTRSIVTTVSAEDSPIVFTDKAHSLLIGFSERTTLDIPPGLSNEVKDVVLGLASGDVGDGRGDDAIGNLLSLLAIVEYVCTN
ncbi:MAG: hypothetical protein LBB38_04650 [Puniceicoccales bacterium]|jgi:hypothetical protein|nr:hypothetical protein [Puniceicoccales bacterium]